MIDAAFAPPLAGLLRPTSSAAEYPQHDNSRRNPCGSDQPAPDLFFFQDENSQHSGKYCADFPP
jgi:hypothetical protein